MINNSRSPRAPRARGFTLVETMLAVLLLSVAIAATLSISSQGITTATVSKDQVTAFYLAQDAVEYVRWLRDTNTLSDPTGDWLAGVDGTSNSHTNDGGSAPNCTGTNWCAVDALQDTVTLCGASAVSCPVLEYDTSAFDYNYAGDSSDVNSLYTRSINLKLPAGNSGEADLTVEVSWCDQASVCAASPRTITVEESLYNWQ